MLGPMEIFAMGAAGIGLLVLLLLGLSLVARILGHDNKHSSDTEAKLVQDLHRTLNSLEKRIESLETIMSDNERSSRERNRF